MKKVALILLLNIYTLAVFGIGVKQFYCCGQLKSTRVSLVPEAKEKKCGAGDEQGGCCQNKYQHFKVKDSHVLADGISEPVKHFSYLHVMVSSVELTPLVTRPANISNPGHAPPLQSSIPLYLFHCNYRI